MPSTPPGDNPKSVVQRSKSAGLMVGVWAGCLTFVSVMMFLAALARFEKGLQDIACPFWHVVYVGVDGFNLAVTGLKN